MEMEDERRAKTKYLAVKEISYSTICLRLMSSTPVVINGVKQASSWGKRRLSLSIIF